MEAVTKKVKEGNTQVIMQCMRLCFKNVETELKDPEKPRKRETLKLVMPPNWEEFVKRPDYVPPEIYESQRPGTGNEEFDKLE